MDSEVAGFILTMGTGRPCDNENYRWFSRRLPDFLYIDRVGVDPSKRGSGIGRRQYAHLFTYAREQQIPLVAAEFDIEPPNHASLAFHERHGFVELGTRVLDHGKVVSMRVKSLGNCDS